MPPDSDGDESIILYFTDFFEVDASVLGDYGALDASLVSDLPLFIDPFLLFNSERPEYQELHDGIIRYMEFLRDKAVTGTVDAGLLKSWYYFKEVRQNWLGFTVLGNDGHALGANFARALHDNLDRLFSEAEDNPSASRHLEKVSLIRGGVGRDGISDFTTNLIKDYLLNYTQTFALAHLREDQRRSFRIHKARFNYETESWEDGEFVLPAFGNDFVLLTPMDMLTRDETWINRPDLFHGFEMIPPAIPDDELRSQVSNYFQTQLGRKPNREQRAAAIQATIDRFPQLLDIYIALKEVDGPRATSVSADKVRDVDDVFIRQIARLVADLTQRTDLYEKPQTSYQEALAKVAVFKRYVESQDGYKLINRKGQPFGTEEEVHLFFGLALAGSLLDANREPNNGRGPVDFKLSRGAYDKSLIEFKLGSNSQLKRNLQNQVAIYEEANTTRHSVKVILFCNAQQEKRVRTILRELEMENREDVVLIDARSDNKPSASRA